MQSNKCEMYAVIANQSYGLYVGIVDSFDTEKKVVEAREVGVQTAERSRWTVRWRLNEKPRRVAPAGSAVNRRRRHSAGGFGLSRSDSALCVSLGSTGLIAVGKLLKVGHHTPAHVLGEAQPLVLGSPASAGE